LINKPLRTCSTNSVTTSPRGLFSRPLVTNRFTLHFPHQLLHRSRSSVIPPPQNRPCCPNPLFSSPNANHATVPELSQNPLSSQNQNLHIKIFLYTYVNIIYFYNILLIIIKTKNKQQKRPRKAEKEKQRTIVANILGICKKQNPQNQHS
jgi:hypothetical protein